MNTFKEGDIIQFTDPRYPWREPDSAHYLLLKNNGQSRDIALEKLHQAARTGVMNLI